MDCIRKERQAPEVVSAFDIDELLGIVPLRSVWNRSVAEFSVWNRSERELTEEAEEYTGCYG